MLLNMLKSEEGQGLMEYALILSLIALIVIGMVSLIGSKAVALYESVEMD